jgi:putative membrane protein
MMWWWGHPDVGWGWMIFGGLMMFAFWGGLIVLVLFAVKAIFGSGPARSSGGYDSAPSRPNRALEILKERYAQGEISKAEYEEMREDLKV